MPVRFTPESNLDGAPSSPMAVEPDLGGVDPRVASLVRDGIPMAQAVKVVADADRARVSAESQEGDARANRRANRREERRGSARGVDPEAIPFNYQTGAPIGTPSQYNQPEAVASAELEARQTWADEETRGLRDGSVRTPGSRAWNAEGLQMGGEFRSSDELDLREEFLNRFGREIRDEQIDGFRRQLANEQAAQLDADLRDRRLGNRRVPAPSGLGGNRPKQGDAFESVEEAEAYYARPDLGGGRYGQSQADRDMRARGFVPVVTPNGVRYTLASDGAPGTGIPGGYGRAGYRGDLVAPEQPTVASRAVQAANEGDLDTPVAMYEEGEKIGTDGRKVHVLAPTAANRQYNNLMERERRLIRQATAANMPIMEFAEQSSAYSDLLKDDAVVARLMAAEGRRKQQQSQTNAWRAQTMLAGGQTTPGSRAAVNAMMGTDDDTQNQIRAYWASGGRGATPLDVQAAAGKQAAALAAQALQGAVANTPAGIAMQQQAEAKKYEEANAAFGTWLDQNAPRRWHGGRPGYTAEQREEARRWLRKRFPDMPPQQIDAIVEAVPVSAPPSPGPPVDPAFPAAGMGGGAL